MQKSLDMRLPNSERSGAVSGNSSSIRLLQESSEHLSHNPLASHEDAAKVLHSLITRKLFSSASLAGVRFCIRSIGYKRENRTFVLGRCRGTNMRGSTWVPLSSVFRNAPTASVGRLSEVCRRCRFQPVIVTRLKAYCGYWENRYDWWRTCRPPAMTLV